MAFQLAIFDPAVREKHVPTADVVRMDKTCDRVSIVGGSSDLRLGIRKHLATNAVVLLIDRYSKNLEPDPVEINTSDVLPAVHGDQVSRVVSDETQISPLKGRVRQVIEPIDSLMVDPMFDVVFKARAG